MFKKAKDINNALLEKLAWMVVTKEDSLCIKILRSKYKVKEDWLRTEALKKASPIWKAIKKTKGVITKGACYMIGDGKSIDVWLDPWVPWVQGYIPSPRNASTPLTPLTVAQLIHPKFHCWKALLIHELFTLLDAQAILSIPIPIRPRTDKLVWMPDLKGCFSVKSAYKQIITQDTTPILWSLTRSCCGSSKPLEELRCSFGELALTLFP